MATISGIDIMNIKAGEGEKGQWIKATLYIHNNKVGHITDNGDGNGISATIASPTLYEEFINKCRKYAVPIDPTTTEITDAEAIKALIVDLCELKRKEDKYRKALKAGSPVMVEIYKMMYWDEGAKNEHVNTFFIEGSSIKRNDGDIDSLVYKILNNARKVGMEFDSHIVYKSLLDFKIERKQHGNI